MRDRRSDALTLLTLNPRADSSGGWVAAATVLGTLAGLLLLLAGLAVFLTIISERFVQGGRYEGGTRPPKPPWMGGRQPFSGRMPIVTRPKRPRRPS